VKRKFFVLLALMFIFSAAFSTRAGKAESGELEDNPLIGEITALTTADVDGDGQNEILGATALEGSVFLYRLENGNLQREFSRYIGSAVWFLGYGDINNDGIDEIYFLDNNGDLWLCTYSQEGLKERAKAFLGDDLWGMNMVKSAGGNRIVALSGDGIRLMDFSGNTLREVAAVEISFYPLQQVRSGEVEIAFVSYAGDCYLYSFADDRIEEVWQGRASEGGGCRILGNYLLLGDNLYQKGKDGFTVPVENPFASLGTDILEKAERGEDDLPVLFYDNGVYFFALPDGRYWLFEDGETGIVQTDTGQTEILPEDVKFIKTKEKNKKTGIISLVYDIMILE
jgi:hypothetical protein